MEDVPEIYKLESIEQLRAFADSRRIHILELLGSKAMTATQVSKLVGETPAKVHYHVRELEKVGLVRLVETREKSGILEKYYRAAGKSLHVPQSLLKGLPADESVGYMAELVESLTSGFMMAFARSNRDKTDSDSCTLHAGSLWLTDDEYERMSEEIKTIIDSYSSRRGTPEERECTYAFITYRSLPGHSREPTEFPARERDTDCHDP